MKGNQLLIGEDTLEKIFEDLGEGVEVEIQQAVLENVLRRRVKAIIPGRINATLNDVIEKEAKTIISENFATFSYGRIEILKNLKDKIAQEVALAIHTNIDEKKDDIDMRVAKAVEEHMAHIQEQVDSYLNRWLEVYLKNNLTQEQKLKLVQALLK